MTFTEIHWNVSFIWWHIQFLFDFVFYAKKSNCCNIKSNLYLSFKIQRRLCREWCVNHCCSKLWFYLVTMGLWSFIYMLSRYFLFPNYVLFPIEIDKMKLWGCIYICVGIIMEYVHYLLQINMQNMLDWINDILTIFLHLCKSCKRCLTGYMWTKRIPNLWFYNLALCNG